MFFLLRDKIPFRMKVLMTDRKGSKHNLWVLILMASLAPFAMQSLVPAMPGMARDFETSFAATQISLTSFILGMAVGQLIYGPLSDQFGRRPVLLAGLGVFFVSSIFCLFAWDILPLLIGRSVQAVGGCAGVVLSRAIIRDLYDRARAAQMIAYVTAAMVIVPMIGPIAGGYLYKWSGWQAIFVVMAGFGLVVTWACYRYLEETNRYAGRHTSLRQMLVSCRSLLRQRRFRGYGFQISFTTASFFSFLGGASAVAVDIYGADVSSYGWWFLMVSGSYMIGNFTSARIGDRVSLDRMITIGTVISMTVAAVMFVVTVFGLLTLPLFFLFSGMISIGNGFSMPNGFAGAVSVDPSLAGTASGLAGALQMGAGAILITFIGQTLDTSPLPVVGMMLTGSFLAWLSHLHGLRR